MISISELSSVALLQLKSSWNRDPSEAKTAVIAAVVVLVPILIGLIQYLKHRRLMAEMRFKTIERLAAQGTLRQEEIRELINPSARKLRVFLVVSWFAMLIGLVLLGFSLAEELDREAGIAGAVLFIVGTGALSAPMMLREMKKQGVL